MKWSNGYRMRLVFVGLMISVFWMTASACLAGEYIWTQKDNMPMSRWSHTTAVVSDKIYVIGGASSESDFRMLSNVEEYDPVANICIRKADMPTARGWMQSSSPVVDGKIYVIGGDDGVNGCLSTVEMYDPIIDTWTRKTDMPTPRWSLATCAVNGKIYAIGGAQTSMTGPNGVQEYDPAIDTWTSNITGLNVVEEYDPVTDTWTRKADMPIGLWGLCANVVNGKIYALGGRLGVTAIPNVYEYDPAMDTWTRKADMPVGTSQMASVIVGDKILVVGGWLISANYPYTAVQMYDPQTDTWTEQDNTPFRRSCCSAGVVNSRAYVIGGTDGPHPCPATSTLYVYDVLVDFSADGIVDSADISMLLDHWGTNDHLYDIGPMPWGDGIVDIQDLIVLSEHLFEEIKDPTLFAHWNLDEAEGNIAHDAPDSAGSNDAVVFGDAVWQPGGGMIGGALQLDGIDDYVSAPFVLNPGIGRFSVFAWVRDGAPGQVVISQTDGANWLLADSAGGNLMTELKGLVKGPQLPLWSQTVITDGAWHHVGFVRDTPDRILYVDGVEVARDTHTSLTRSESGLYLGVGKDLEPRSYWSGLIDDVCIYNRAVSP